MMSKPFMCMHTPGGSGGRCAAGRIVISLLGVLIVCISSLLFGGDGAEIIYRSDPEFQYAEFGAIESGRNITGNQHAVTRSEFRYRILGSLPIPNDSFTPGGKVQLSPGVTAFHNSYQDTRGNDRHYPLAMIYLYDKMPKAASITLFGGLNDTLYSKMTYSMCAAKSSIDGGSGVLHPLSFDSYMSGDSPDEGYISYSMKYLSVTIGRFKGGIGNGLMGNLFQNSLAPYYDQLQFSLYNKTIKYYFMIGFSSSELTDDEYKVQNSLTNTVDYQKTWGKLADSTRIGERISDSSKIFAFHRVEFFLFEKMVFGLGEMNLIGGNYPTLSVINPLSVYHDTYDSRRSYYFSTDLSFIPAKRHFLFLELLSNEIRVPGERSGDPTALAFQGGYWYILPLGNPVKHRLAFEYTHVDTWTYSDSVPYLTMYQRQKRRETLYDVPLGYSQGGDCQQFSLMYTALSPEGFNINLSATHLQKGGVRFTLDEEGEMPYKKAHTYRFGPSGTVEKWYSGECKVSIPVNERFSVGVLCHGSYITNFNNEKGNKGYLLMASLSSTVKI